MRHIGILILIILLFGGINVPIAEGQYQPQVHPRELAILSGNDAVYYITIVSPEKIYLRVEGVPPGSDAKFDPQSGQAWATSGFLSKLTVRTSDSTPPGDYRLIIIADIGNTEERVEVELKVAPKTEDGASIVLYRAYANYLDPQFWVDHSIVALVLFSSDFDSSFTNPFSILKKFVSGVVASKLSLAESLTKEILTLTNFLPSTGMSGILSFTCSKIATCPIGYGKNALVEISELVEHGDKAGAAKRIGEILPGFYNWLSEINGYQPDGMIVTQRVKEAAKNLVESCIRFLEAEKERLKSAPSPAPSPSAGSDVVFVLDISGSMSESWKGEVKIDSAKRSAISLLSLLSSGDRVSVVCFESTASLKLPLSDDKKKAIEIVRSLSAGGNTNMGDAIVKALEELKRNARAGSPKSIIFFTDGMLNTGMTEGEIINGPLQDAISMGVKIYTIGYGDPSKINENFLRTLAEKTGGKYYYSSDAYQLENDFIETGHLASGWQIISTFTGKVRQGELRTAGSVNVMQKLNLLKVVLNWRGSILNLKIISPSGIPVDLSSPNVEYSGETNPQYVIIHDPETGSYTIQVYGKDVEGEEDYRVWAFGIPAEGGSSGGGGGGGGGGGSYVYPLQQTQPAIEEEKVDYSFIPLSIAIAALILSAAIYYSYRPSYFLTDRRGNVIIRSSKRDRVYGREDFAGLLSGDVLKFISRREKGGQFRIFRQGKWYYIVDNFSTNPTHLNGVIIRGRGPLKLENGSIISIPGAVELVFRYS